MTCSVDLPGCAPVHIISPPFVVASNNVSPSACQGIFITGSFTPNRRPNTCPRRRILCHATFIIARLSLFTSIPGLPSTDDRASPHGLAVRFVLGPASKLGTDIIRHASKLFPGSDGEDVLAFFRSLGGDTVTEYTSSHPAAAAFAQENRPTPKSFAHETFHSVNAFKLVNAEERITLVRYRWVPLAGEQKFTQNELKAKLMNFLLDELPEIFQGPIVFSPVAQVAEQGNITDDCTKIWPEHRQLIELRTSKIEKVMGAKEALTCGTTISFSPVPRVEHIEASADPILAARSAVYSTSSKSRFESEMDRLLRRSIRCFRRVAQKRRWPSEIACYYMIRSTC